MTPAVQDIRILSEGGVHSRLDGILALSDEEIAANSIALATELLEIGESALERWLLAAGRQPADKPVEGFRLLGLHRQGAKGDPSFNACRETCRELIYLYNCVCLDETNEGAARNLRMAAMVARHLELFIDGKLENSGLGEFCCSSRPIRSAERPAEPDPIEQEQDHA
ncbi:hypothetical protein [Hoeflea sp. TYP-13]|uniref:hypothetical protein n=1 Tax=Hoeflea sp. TYP-13 TaxID=3230023 RepID=UPI0034C61B5C